MNFFVKDDTKAIDAISKAQWIAYAPVVFQICRILRDKGILQYVKDTKDIGLSIEDASEKCGLSFYATRVLMQGGLGAGVFTYHENKFFITKTGIFILSNKMTRVNMDFVHDVCYLGLFNLEESLESGKPEGLKFLGDWPTVYEGLSELPEKVRKSWFAFDHFYSDDAFDQVLPIVFKHNPSKLLDIGGNTGKWALKCMNYDGNVQMGLLDLPGQLNVAIKNIQNAGLSHRASYHFCNVLKNDAQIPKGYDIIWMSQFLDCFSDSEIISILNRCREALSPGGRVIIMEPLWDNQEFKVGAFCLQQTSPYFTCIANGNSQMYDTETFFNCIQKAGFVIEEKHQQIGVSQTLLVCKLG